MIYTFYKVYQSSLFLQQLSSKALKMGKRMKKAIQNMISSDKSIKEDNLTSAVSSVHDQASYMVGRVDNLT